ncbi:Cna B-type domain-containing protein, partial [Mesorhizobium atlanticum]
MADITDNLTGDPLATSDPTTTGSTDPVAPIAISLDQADADYAPGETVGITTSNVSDGATFTFEVAHLSAGADGVLGTADDVLAYDLTGTGTPWTVTDGGAGDLDGVVNGSIQTSWYVNGDAANQAFMLTASDTTSDASATVTFTDAPKPPPPPTPPPTTFAYADTHIDITADNTIVNAAGAVFSSRDTTIFSNLVSGSSGTGNWSVFSQIQSAGNAGAEQGYNSADGVLDEKTSSQHNMVIALNSLVKVDADGTVDPNGAYYAFRLDMHQTGANPFLSLDQLKIYQSADGNLGAGSFAAGPSTVGTDPNFHFTSGNTTLAYNMNAGGANSVLMDAEYDSGSGGGGDVIVLVPTANFNPANGNFLYFYTAMGFQGGGWSDSGTFEEWSALTQPATFSISGTKYTDVKGDDTTTHNADDTPLANITINLYASGAPNTVIASTVTAVDGSYSFNNLGVLPNNQNYIVKEVLPSGDTQTLGNNGYIISSTIGTNSTGNDFANFVNFSISGTKYTDVKGDDTTTHNADDTPLANITINLYASNDLVNPIAQTTTAADGSYHFDNLGPLSGGQTYVVQEVLPSGDVETLGKDGYIVAATSGNTTTGEDFANFVKFSISGTKYTDVKGDDTTTHNADDMPLANITINLYASNDLVNPIAQTTTAADGSYHFDNLGPLSGGQTYVVQEVLPSGDVETLGKDGYIVAATSGNTTTGEDFANFVKFSISGTKYTDVKGDDTTTHNA